MKNNKQKTILLPGHKKNGYAILFVVVIVSIISIIAVGISSTTFKQLILSSLANDSQVSFYQSDTAVECALYAQNIVGLNTIQSGSSWPCGKDINNANLSFIFNPGQLGTYSFLSTISTQPWPCFDFNIVETSTPILNNTLNPDDVGTINTTNIYGRGYNNCIKTNPRTVEREIKVTYSYDTSGDNLDTGQPLVGPYDGTYRIGGQNVTLKNGISINRYKCDKFYRRRISS